MDLNIYETAKEYLNQIQGLTFRALDAEIKKKLVIFLDIDDSLGMPIFSMIRPLDIEVEKLEQSTSENERIANIRRVQNGDMFIIEYYSKGPSEWVKVEITFACKNFLKELNLYFKDNNINDVFLFSAAGPTYVECIRRILNTYYGFTINNVFSANMTNKTIFLIKNNQEEIIALEDYYENELDLTKIVKGTYHAKDMWKVLQELGYDNSRIPILFDDRDYWGANGFVVRINRLNNNISDYLDNPIRKCQGLLISNNLE